MKMTNDEALIALNNFTDQEGVHFETAEPDAYMSIKSALMSRSDYQIKTCKNCKYYIDILQSDSTDFRIHNYCEVWNSQIPAWYSNDLFSHCSYNDIDNHIACCWCWKSKKE